MHQGHFAMLPVALQYEEFLLPSKDPLPIHGGNARAQAIKECTTLLNVPLTKNRDVSLPMASFPATGEILSWA